MQFFYEDIALYVLFKMYNISLENVIFWFIRNEFPNKTLITFSFKKGISFLNALIIIILRH